MTTLTIEQASLFHDPRRLCETLRERYATEQPLGDADLHTLGIVRQALILVERLLIQRSPHILSPAHAVDALVLEMSALEREEVRVLLLNRRNHVIDVVTLYRGTTDTCVSRIAEFFRPAIIAGASSILVIHNHPSGDPSPSPEDVVLTQHLAKAGDLLDIETMDHIIIAGGHFLSLKERGHWPS